jgi:hypothetical protein
MSKMLVSLNDLSSASCDLNDVIGSLKRRKGLDGLQEVKQFLENLYPSELNDDKYAEVEIDSAKLKTSINQLQALCSSLEQKTRNESKDDEDSETTIEDCMEDVLVFLKSLTD